LRHFGTAEKNAGGFVSDLFGVGVHKCAYRNSQGQEIRRAERTLDHFTLWKAAQLGQRIRIRTKQAVFSVTISEHLPATGTSFLFGAVFSSWNKTGFSFAFCEFCEMHSSLVKEDSAKNRRHGGQHFTKASVCYLSSKL
jgi:hypothetical protein